MIHFFLEDKYNTTIFEFKYIPFLVCKKSEKCCKFSDFVCKWHIYAAEVKIVVILTPRITKSPTFCMHGPTKCWGSTVKNYQNIHSNAKKLHLSPNKIY